MNGWNGWNFQSIHAKISRKTPQKWNFVYKDLWIPVTWNFKSPETFGLLQFKCHNSRPGRSMFCILLLLELFSSKFSNKYDNWTDMAMRYKVLEVFRIEKTIWSHDFMSSRFVMSYLWLAPRRWRAKLRRSKSEEPWFRLKRFLVTKSRSFSLLYGSFITRNLLSGH